MNKHPILTIAIPTFNGSRTIGNMLDILLPQVDWNKVEIIVSDNYSIDETKDIIEKYLLEYPLISYQRNSENIGADANFLKCMRMAKGKYVYLLSDDDILVENSLDRIVSFLENNDDMGLVYLGTANFYTHYNGRDNCVRPIPLSKEDMRINDKNVFWDYARHYWGFLSSFIILREKFEKIDNPERFFGTYWLQSYIHVLCAAGENTYLGIVGGLSVGAGVYITQSNYDTSYVDGISYRAMLNLAIDNGFDKKQIDKWFIDRFCLLASHGIVKEKALGRKIINKKQMFNVSYRFPKAWVYIYPMMLVPSFVCRLYMKSYRRRKGADYNSEINREGDVSVL